MHISLPTTLNILRDSREKKPLPFPKTLHTYITRTGKAHLFCVRDKCVTMPFGDYALEGFEARCTIERKGSVRELQQNLLTDDYKRFMCAIKRLQDSTKFPIILLDFNLAEATRRTKYVKEPERVMDMFWSLMFRLQSRKRLGVLWLGNGTRTHPRLKKGEQIIRVLLKYSLDFGDRMV